MARVLMVLRGSVVNGIEFGSAEAARDEANRVLRELIDEHDLDPARSTEFDVGDICNVTIADKERGPIYVLGSDPAGRHALAFECSDRGSARAALVRLVRDLVDRVTKEKFNDAMDSLGRRAEIRAQKGLASMPPAGSA